MRRGGDTLVRHGGKWKRVASVVLKAVHEGGWVGGGGGGGGGGEWLYTGGWGTCTGRVEVGALGVITISRGCFERCGSNKKTPP